MCCTVAIREQDWETLYCGICMAVGPWVVCLGPADCGFSLSCIFFANLTSSSVECPSPEFH